MFCLNRKSNFSLLILSILLLSCAQEPLVPLSEQSINKNKDAYHIVGGGDTLYSVAFLRGIDFRVLADWNNINAPYIIKRGQRLSLVKPKQRTRISKTTQSSATTQSNEISISLPNSDVQNNQRIEIKPQIINQPRVTPQRRAKTKRSMAKFNNTWKWPISIKGIINFKKSSQNKGVDIISRHGVSVKASASGKVVYAGNGLNGYGNLVIIKHNDTYLSAYAHNRSINVREGDLINQGEKIAEVGSSDSRQAKLHFEIRKNGSPVNPLFLLPKKVG